MIITSKMNDFGVCLVGPCSRGSLQLWSGAPKVSKGEILEISAVGLFTGNLRNFKLSW